jgi:predicted deacetylase
MNKIILIMLLILLSLIFTLFFIRLIFPKEIDDVSPEIFCEKEYLEKSDILWVIPKFNNKLISENSEWCNYILGLNKTLGFHGVYHKFEEFGTNRSKEYLEEGIKIFEDCFGFKPEMFKPPQLEINKENKKLINENNLKLKGKINQLFHKVYHCSDTGRFKNLVIDFI